MKSSLPFTLKTIEFKRNKNKIVGHTTTLYPMISYWHNPDICPSVRPSVCDAVHCGSQGRCTGLKVVPACVASRHVHLSRQTVFPAVYRLATKRTEKTSVQENVNVRYLRQTIRRALVALFTDFMTY